MILESDVNRALSFVLLASCTSIGLGLLLVFAVQTGSVHGIGMNNDLIFYVNGLTETSKAGSWFPDQGFKFLLIDITVKNKNNNVSKVLVDYEFEVEASDRSKYSLRRNSEAFWIKDMLPYRFPINITARDIVRGIIPIQIPNDTSGRALYYNGVLIADLSSKKTPPDPPPKSEVVLKANKGFNITIEWRPIFVVGLDFLNDRIVSEAGAYWPKAEGWKYYVVKLVYSNVGKYEGGFRFADFFLKDEYGFISPSGGAVSSEGDFIEFRRLQPSEKIELEVIFRVPSDRNKFMIMFSDWSTDHFKISPLIRKPITYVEESAITTTPTSTSTPISTVQPENLAGVQLMVGAVIAVSAIVLTIMLIRRRHPTKPPT